MSFRLLATATILDPLDATSVNSGAAAAMPESPCAGIAPRSVSKTSGTYGDGRRGAAAKRCRVPGRPAPVASPSAARCPAVAAYLALKQQEPPLRAPGPGLLQRLAGHRPSDRGPALPLSRPDRGRPAPRRGGDAPGRQGPPRRPDQRPQRRRRAGRGGDAAREAGRALRGGAGRGPCPRGSWPASWASRTRSRTGRCPSSCSAGAARTPVARLGRATEGEAQTLRDPPRDPPAAPLERRPAPMV